MTNESEAFTPIDLPVLPLDDEVVLPGMVVPLDLSDTEVRAAVEAAQAAARPEGGKPEVLLVPRIDGTYTGTGVLGTVEQVGRLSDGDPGALIRARDRVRIGAGTSGPGRALWVEGTVLRTAAPDPLPGAAAELVKEYKALATSWLKKRGAWQVVDRVQQIDDVSALADNSGYSPFLTTAQKVQLLETVDPVARLRLAIQWLGEHLAVDRAPGAAHARWIAPGRTLRGGGSCPGRGSGAVDRARLRLGGGHQLGDGHEGVAVLLERVDDPGHGRHRALIDVVEQDDAVLARLVHDALADQRGVVRSR
ncbi:hypothetical protein SCALM49S_09234 [Streptomyces californicus]